MEIIPAIDIRGGRCVRLYKGDFDQETVFSDDPVAIALQWQTEGAQRLHIVDLDGARTGLPQNLPIIKTITDSLDIPIQVGGGLRSIESITEVIDLGAERVVLGTSAVEEPDLVEDVMRRFGPQAIVVGVDARDGLVAVRGWIESSVTRAVDLVKEMVDLGVVRFLYTDISRDGTLTEPNFAEVTEVVETSNMAVLASGGITSLEHLKCLSEVGAEGAIVGKALYTGAIDLRHAFCALKET
jgi:phosphoribosylformimino-5-aminoimidazole carboxamide ribotide isomerase